ncbi:mitochondrial ribosomal protein [Hirsutella rhossiliensis]|uniref:Mitochondrial ribosomal protein n=1 Tax=Hirsutella rhossiliensis TaxID=111463 RepID=A0A9P8SIY3_9HYPO|nr:mitochondrial ribosomal protein [Hirsutella rhossiliensis]KAH0963664.1 mitochondrial ribosomal protein [Hirsutella rhossiliensis]
MGKFPHLPLAFAPSRTGPLSTTTPCSFTPKSTSAQQIRHATFIPRPRRPYTFTQLVQLTDGSTYTMRTTSPAPIYRAAKDTRNTLLWQPSEKSLRNVELDEAGKLAAFRERFGRGFDASAASGEEGAEEKDADNDFADLIAGYAPQDAGAMKDTGKKKNPTRRK